MATSNDRRFGATVLRIAPDALSIGMVLLVMIGITLLTACANRDSKDVSVPPATRTPSADATEPAPPARELIPHPPDDPRMYIIRNANEEQAQDEANQESRKRLKHTMPVDFDRSPFEQVIDYFRNQTGLDIVVNWNVIKEAGLKRDAPVTLRLTSVPADRALRLVLDQVGGEVVPLNWAIVDGVITISTIENLGRNTNIRTYDIRDLIQAPDEESRRKRIDAVITLIRTTVDPTGWRSNGGRVSNMSELNGTLIVSTTAQNHRAILQLLQRTRHGPEDINRDADQETSMRERKAAVSALLVHARNLIKESNYHEAMNILDHLLFIDPNNLAGQAYKEMTEDAILYRALVERNR